MSDSPSPDYSAFPSVVPASAPLTLASLAALVERARDEEDAVARADQDLKEARERLRRIVEGELPEAMSAVGLKEFRTRDDLVVRIKDDVQVKQPPVDQRAPAYAWLERNGQGGLIKRSVEIAFGAGPNEAERAVALADRLGVDFPGAVRRQEEVNTTSLKAYLVRAVAAGESPPMELFGARPMRVAKFEQK